MKVAEESRKELELKLKAEEHARKQDQLHLKETAFREAQLKADLEKAKNDLQLREQADLDKAARKIAKRAA